MEPLSEWQRVLLGIASSACARTLTSPFDIFKIIGQIGAKTPNLYNTVNFEPFPRNVLPLWTGNLISCIRLVPYQLFKYIIVADLKKAFKNHRRKRPHLSSGLMEELLIGMAATVGAAAITFPLTNIRVRLVAQLALRSPVYQGPIDAWKKIIATEGWAGLFSGFWPILLGIVVFEGASYFGFRFFKYRKEYLQQISNISIRWLHNLEMEDTEPGIDGEETEEERSVVSNVVEGTCITCFATILAHPFEVIGRRLLTQHMLHGTEVYNNSIECVQKLLKEEGIGWLFGGLLPAVLRVAPYALCVLITYRLLCILSQRRKTERQTS